jgi:hypothetical protein
VPAQAPAELLKAKRASGAIWVAAAAMLLAVAACAAVVAPFSRRVTLLNGFLPLLATAVVLFGGVLALGPAATCRPALRPDLVQPWLPSKEPELPKSARNKRVSAS